jgi:micrococcal nuclease
MHPSRRRPGTRPSSPSGRNRVALGALVLVVAGALVACDGGEPRATDRADTPPPTSAASAVVETRPDGADATVTSITDGDTIRVRTAAGVEERVRLIGIDTPETSDPRTVVECFGREASAQTAALLPIGTRVLLELDVETRDRYGRMLAYVHRADDDLFVNEALIAGGWAAPYRYPPNVRYADRFSALGRDAREKGVGLWSACGGTDTPAGTPAPLVGSASSSDGSACDANYSGACIPVSSTDLDCADAGARNFQVVGADPHGFDGNHDGVACES